jgi:hypothetical protein
MAGRPTKLNAELTEQIAKLVEEGDPAEVAAGVCGIGRQTFYDWMARGKHEESGAYADFRTAIERARDLFASELRRRILNGDGQGVGFGRAKAALEVITRRDPRRWGVRVKHEIDDVSRLSAEALERVCSRPDVFERVCKEKDLSVVFVAWCEEFARDDSEAEAGALPSSAAGSIH